jgi:hydrogenase small subunit
MLSGHGCIGCAEPDFWDMGKLGPLGDKQGFYFRLTKALDYDGHGRGRACNSCHDGDGF